MATLAPQSPVFSHWSQSQEAHALDGEPGFVGDPLALNCLSATADIAVTADGARPISGKMASRHPVALLVKQWKTVSPPDPCNTQR